MIQSKSDEYAAIIRSGSTDNTIAGLLSPKYICSFKNLN